MTLPSFRRPSGRVALAVLAVLAVAFAVFVVGYSAGQNGGVDVAGTADGESLARTADAPTAGGSDLAFSSDAQSAGGTDASKAAPDDVTTEPATGSAAGETPRRLVRTAQQDLRVDDVAAAAARVRTVATSLGGSVSSESLSFGDGYSSLTVRVPEGRLDDALARTAELGKELNRTTTAEDVTATVADLESRVKTQEASVTRVRALLAGAKSLKDVVLLEGELTRREADLEAAQARFKALDDQATMATLDLTLSSADTRPTPKPDDGFLAGFGAGWDAIKASTTVLLTVAGAVLPFALVLGVVLVPVLVLRRRRSAGSTSPTD